MGGVRMVTGNRIEPDGTALIRREPDGTGLRRVSTGWTGLNRINPDGAGDARPELSSLVWAEPDETG